MQEIKNLNYRGSLKDHISAPCSQLFTGFSPFIIWWTCVWLHTKKLLHRFYLLLLKVRTEKTKFLINERERFFFDEKEVLECMWVVVFVPGSSICRSLLWCCDLRYNYELYGPYRQYIRSKHNCCKKYFKITKQFFQKSFDELYKFYIRN